MSAATLSPMIQTFILHFGEMGGRWGVSRTVGQIYALLFLSKEPLNAERIAAALGFSRSNVSMGLKELQAWSLVRMRHIPDDRRDHFTTPEDLWDILRILAGERKKREVDPTLSMLREALMGVPGAEGERYAQTRMQEMLDMIEMLVEWYDDISRIDSKRLKKLISLGSKVQKILDVADGLTGRDQAQKTGAQA